MNQQKCTYLFCLFLLSIGYFLQKTHASNMLPLEKGHEQDALNTYPTKEEDILLHMVYEAFGKNNDKKQPSYSTPIRSNSPLHYPKASLHKRKEEEKKKNLDGRLRPYPCYLCFRSYEKKEGLLKHMLSSHPNDLNPSINYEYSRGNGQSGFVSDLGEERQCRIQKWKKVEETKMGSFQSNSCWKGLERRNSEKFYLLPPKKGLNTLWQEMRFVNWKLILIILKKKSLNDELRAMKRLRELVDKYEVPGILMTRLSHHYVWEGCIEQITKQG